MSTNGLMKMMMKFKNTGDGIAPGRGRRPIPMEVVNEVAMVVPDRAERALNSATSARVVSRELGVPWSTKKFSTAFYAGTPTRFRLCCNLKPHNLQHLDFAFKFLAEMEMDDMAREYSVD